MKQKPSSGVHPCMLFLAFLALGPARGALGNGITSDDTRQLAFVDEAVISPDGARIAYTVRTGGAGRRPSTQIWLMDLGTGVSRPFRDGREQNSPRWSPDGKTLAYLEPGAEGTSLFVCDLTGGEPRSLALLKPTNHPLPGIGERLAWSPDGKSLVFLSAEPGPEGESSGDPTVITRYLYKPPASGPGQRFNDNRRLHIFLADVAAGTVRALTHGPFHDHSPSWSPSGSEIAFVSNREDDPDRSFNNDIFVVRVADGALRRLTQTRNAEYSPSWSPSGKAIAYLATKRPLTSSETTMEDEHVWIMDEAGGKRRELGSLDLRQAQVRWAPDGEALYFTVQERGSVRLHRLRLSTGITEALRPAKGEVGAVGSFSVARTGAIAFSLTTPGSPAELFLETPRGETRLTSLNRNLLAVRAPAEVESFTFPSFDGVKVEAFLTKPALSTPSSRHPLILMLHGGPHAQQGPGFNPRAQVFANQGWASLMVNFRGSTGYGQKFADAIFGDQNGGEAKDALAGLQAALARYSWVDPDRLGIEGTSYGGQLANWIVTQTARFRAGVSMAGIANLVSFNYMAYYHDYLAVEFGSYPHEGGLLDTLWQRSPLRFVSRVKTPMLLVHGEEDNDVPIAEAEQFFIALKDVGVETVLVRYPREGHGIRETAHVVDLLNRSVAWYRAHFETGPRK